MTLGFAGVVRAPVSKEELSCDTRAVGLTDLRKFAGAVTSNGCFRAASNRRPPGRREWNS